MFYSRILIGICNLILPVCVELIGMGKEIEIRNVSGGSRLNRFLLDEQHMLSCIFLVREF